MLKAVWWILLNGFIANDIYKKNQSKALRTVIIILFILLIGCSVILLINEIVILEIIETIITAFYICCYIRHKRKKVI